MPYLSEHIILHYGKVYGIYSSYFLASHSLLLYNYKLFCSNARTLSYDTICLTFPALHSAGIYFTWTGSTNKHILFLLNMMSAKQTRPTVSCGLWTFVRILYSLHTVLILSQVGNWKYSHWPCCGLVPFWRPNNIWFFLLSHILVILETSEVFTSIIFIKP